jgi:hypothetical protein
MTVNPAKLRANARKLDALNGKVANVLTAMQRGEALHHERTWYGGIWWTSNGRQVSGEVARVVIQSANVASVGDALFDNVPAQTWRWIES